jgi:DNA-binding MarR family transcriptional regulator
VGTTAAPPLAEQLIDALSAVRRTIRRASGRPVELADLTGAQVELVRLLRRTPGLRVADAAAELRLAPNTVSTLVGQLTDVGVVVRSVDPDDRRTARLALSPDVHRQVEAWRDRRLANVAAAIDALGDDDRRTLAKAVPVLERLGEALSA